MENVFHTSFSVENVFRTGFSVENVFRTGSSVENTKKACFPHWNQWGKQKYLWVSRPLQLRNDKDNAGKKYSTLVHTFDPQLRKIFKFLFIQHLVWIFFDQTYRIYSVLKDMYLCTLYRCRQNIMDDCVYEE